MAVSEDLDVYLDAFGVPAVWTDASGEAHAIEVIFDQENELDVSDGIAVDVTKTTAETKTASVAGMARGNRMTVHGTTYVVELVKPDAANPDWSVVTLGTAK